MWLTYRPLNKSEISHAIGVHDYQWKEGRPEVLNPEDIQKHIENNHDFQIGAFWESPNGIKGRKKNLIAVVHGARYLGGAWEKTAHYDDIRAKVNGIGDTVTCFIISSAPKMAHVTAEMTLPHLYARGLKKIAEGLIRETKYTAAWHGVKYVRAASTPSGINKVLNIPLGQNATRQDAVRYLDMNNDPAIHVTHEALGAKIGGIKVDGRPNSKNLTGAGLLIWMDYNLHSITVAELAAWRLHKEIEPEFVRRLFESTGKGNVPRKPLLTLRKNYGGHEVGLVLDSDDVELVTIKIREKLNSILNHLKKIYPKIFLQTEISSKPLPGNQNLSRIKIRLV